ncbi:MAG: helix-turn-helix domain-containing protein [Verrucomicrobiales bacterium]|nr:helix-turn-helix domain-containing protein [Verrucomicrobiales bacterium]
MRGSGSFLPTSLDDVQQAETCFGPTPIELPVKLRSPEAVLDQIKKKQSLPNAPVVFGQLVTMLRLQKGLSHDLLAKRAGIDLAEVEKIESDRTYVPKPRTVSAVAKYFGLSPKNLARVAKLSQMTNEKVFDGAVRFAACSNQQFDQLSPEQKKALREFLKVLKDG